MAFNPDKYLEESETVESSFDPDSYLADSEPEVSEEPSKLESFLRGGLQGATFGTSDEITGAGEAVAKTIFGDDKLTDILDNYRKYRDESREAYKAAEEANPATYMTGDVLTGIGTGLLTGGAGAVANLGRVGARQGLKELAKQGAKHGAAYGLGQSEADLTKGELGEVALDTGVGATAGAALGAALPTVTKGAGKLSSKVLDTVKGSRLGQNFSDAKSLSERGIDFLGRDQKDKLITESNEVANKLLDEFQSQYKTGSKKIGEALSSDARPKDVSEAIKSIESEIKKNPMDQEDLGRIEGLLSQYRERFQLPDRVVKTGQVEGKDIKGVNKALDSLEKTLAKAKAEADTLGQSVSFTDPEIIPEANIVQSLQTTRNELGEIVPKVRQVNIPADEFEAAQTLIDYVPGGFTENYKNLTLQELQIFKQQMQSLANSNKLDNYAKSQASKASRELDNLIKENMSKSARSSYEQGNEMMSKVHRASDFMKEIGSDEFERSKARIDLADKMRKPSDKRNQYIDEVSGLLDVENPELFQQIKDIGTKARLQKSTEGAPILGLAPSPSAMSTYAGAATGKVTSSDVVKKPIEIASNLLNLPDQGIQRLSESLRNSQSPSNVKIADKLTEALNSADKRDRLLWSLSRQPAFRQAVEELGFDFAEVDREGLFDSSEAQNQPEMSVSPETPSLDQDEIRRRLLEQYRNR